jgi:hypothetical protein
MSINTDDSPRFTPDSLQRLEESECSAFLISGGALAAPFRKDEFSSKGKPINASLAAFAFSGMAPILLVWLCHYLTTESIETAKSIFSKCNLSNLCALRG